MHILQTKLLDHLCRVAVAVGRKSADHPAALRMVRTRVGRLPTFRRADFNIHDHRFGQVQQIILTSGKQRQDRGRGVAAHPADIAGAVHFFAVQLRQAVDEFAHPVRRGMLVW